MNVDSEVLNVLGGSKTVGNNLILSVGLSRPLYLRTNIVLEAAGGKWNRSTKAHTFPGDAAEAIDQIMLTGQITIPQDFGFFPSPPAVVARLMELAGVRSRHHCLEPQAGDGAIVRALAATGARVWAVELLEAKFKKLAALRATGTCDFDLWNGDFLARPTCGPKFDRIVMNPPFAKQADIIHINHALKMLKPVGLLTSVMASGVLFRENRATVEFRKMVEARGGEFEELPDDSFKASGTSVRTVIVSIPGA